MEALSQQQKNFHSGDGASYSVNSTLGNLHTYGSDMILGCIASQVTGNQYNVYLLTSISETLSAAIESNNLGQFNIVPAYETNNNASVPINTIVRISPGASGEFVFEHACPCPQSGGDGGGDGVNYRTRCCPEQDFPNDVVPGILHATISHVTGCPAIEGLSITMPHQFNNGETYINGNCYDMWSGGYKYNKFVSFFPGCAGCVSLCCGIWVTLFCINSHNTCFQGDASWFGYVVQTLTVDTIDGDPLRERCDHIGPCDPCYSFPGFCQQGGGVVFYPTPLVTCSPFEIDMTGLTFISYPGPCDQHPSVCCSDVTTITFDLTITG